MKNINIFRCVAAFVMAMTLPIAAKADDTALKFNVEQVAVTDMPADVAKAIYDKLIVALNRVEAVDESPYNVNIIRSTLDFTENVETEGLMREVARVTADLTLTAVNGVDGTVYNSVVIPLSGTAAGGKDAAMRKLANSLKPTDAVYVRFVRTTRKRIMEHYTNNCGNIIAQAQQLMTTGRYAEAASYLQGVQPSVPCFDQAEGLLNEVMPYLNQPSDTVVVENVVEVPVERVVEVPSTPDTVVVEKVVEKIVRVPQESSLPQGPSAPTGLGEVTIEGDNLDFKVLSCKGDLSRRTIKLTARVVNYDTERTSCYVRVINAFTPDGIELNDTKLNTNSYGSGYVSMPDGVPVTINAVFVNIRSRIDLLTYMELEIRGIKVTIRNLPVSW